MHGKNVGRYLLAVIIPLEQKKRLEINIDSKAQDLLNIFVLQDCGEWILSFFICAAGILSLQ